MTTEEFNKEMARLNEAFKNYYGKERAALIGRVIRDLPKIYFNHKISEVLWSKEPPKIEWFHQISNEFYAKQETQIADVGDCGICNGYGWTTGRKFVEDLQREYSFAYPCTCAAGKKQCHRVKLDDGYRDLKTWDDVKGEDGFVWTGGAIWGKLGE